MLEPASDEELPDNDPGTTTLGRLKMLDNPTWAKLVETHFDRVYQWCRDAGLDDHTAADVSQDVFVSALGSLHRFQRDPSSSFVGWLRRISQRRIADLFRRRPDLAIGGTDALGLFSQLTSLRDSLSPDCHDAEIENERLLAAVAAVQVEFETDSWRAFWLTTVDGRRATDVAFELGMTRNAVYLAKSRVLKRLRAVLGTEK